MKNRFDLEQEIMQCWSVVDDIERLRHYMCDKKMTEDELDNYLLGLKTIYSVKFEQLFDTFEDCLQRNEFKNPEF